VHLPGEADARDIFGAETGFGDGFGNGDATGTPPIFGMLLGPSDFWRSEGRVFFGCGCDDAPVLVDDESASSAGANVDAE
jgi:hypothetical protein